MTRHEALPTRYLHHLDYLRCYAILLVVVIHVSATGFYLPPPARPMSSWWVSTGFNAFARSCVPLFLMASGATLLDSAKVDPVGRFLLRRVRRIGVPLFIWSLVYLADRKWLMGEALTAKAVVRYLVSGATFYHLPFFYYLIGLYLSAPVLARFAESARGGTLLYFVVLWSVVACIQLVCDLSGIPFGLTIPAIAGFAGYFVLGRALRDTAISGGAVIACFIVVVAASLVTAHGTYDLSLKAGQPNELLLEYSRPNVMAMSVATYLLLSSEPVRLFASRHVSITRLVQQSATLSFGIFLIHPLLLQVVIPWLHLGWDVPRPWVGIPLTTVCTVALSGLLVWLLRQCPGIRSAVS